METDRELLDRCRRVRIAHDKAKLSAERAKSPGRRDAKSRFAGSLFFTLGQIESEIEDRGLTS